ncbi:hypothetical protein ACFFHJ_06400 [Planotetraspora thailandica]|uniref:hypothetical protein n=1 Tax=Planotetraspora thailandica TaxID=487172 RepID=UPI001950F46F|nr:hypothetical protein [Planotetraspora thailandica]
MYPTPLDGLARNPGAPIPILLKLLDTDSAFEFHFRRHMPVELIDAMVAHPRPRVRRILAENPHVSDKQRARLVYDPDPSVRATIAAGDTDAARGRLTLPPEAYEVLISDEDAGVRQALTDTPRLPEHLWQILLADPDPAVHRSAMLRLAPQRPDVAAALVDDPSVPDWYQGTLLSAAALPSDRFVRLASDPNIDVRAAVAANRYLPHDLLLALGHDPEPSVRLAASMNPLLTEEERATIDYTIRPHDRVWPPAWWFDCLDDLRLMRQAAESAHLGLRRAAAYSPYLPPDQLTRLAGDDDFIVRLLIAENHPDAPGELLVSTTIESQFITKYDQIHHRNFPHAGLAARVASSPDPHTRLLAVFDPTAPASLIEALSREFPSSNASRDPRLPLDRVLELYADDETAPVAAQNPLLPMEKMLEILNLR